MNIFVGSLSFKTTEEELQKEFEKFGEVSSAKIILDRETLKSRGFAFVEMPNSEQAQAAIAGMNGKELDGQILKVNEAKPKEARGPRDRERSGGGYGSGNRSSGWGGGHGGGHGGGYGGGRSGGYGGGDANSNIYDTKGQGRGRGGRGSGGRSGGGKRTPR
jgi:RNA recognition motif-containing protein